jgi:threonine/homoserine/homoserine lactone efflux protein
MMHFLTMGTVLGLSAGFAPGPLLALIISETLEHDIKSGIKVAIAPIITDLPIIILTLFVISKLSNFHHILGLISLAGGCFILFMAYNSIRTKGMIVNLENKQPKSLSKGALVNILSPNPYLFWFSVGAPIMNKAMSLNSSASAVFIISFYTFLVGTKIVLAVLIGQSKSFLTGNVYINIMRLLGLLLVILALGLFQNGLELLEIIKVN